MLLDPIRTELPILIQVASCIFMTGVILVIQLIHYPSFVQIEKTQFVRFHSHHSRALAVVAGPAMTVELFSAVWIGMSGTPAFIANLLGVAMLWGLTFLVSVPLHNRLSRGFDERSWRRLVRTNWLRTFLWSARSAGWLAWILAKDFPGF